MKKNEKNKSSQHISKLTRRSFIRVTAAAGTGAMATVAGIGATSSARASSAGPENSYTEFSCKAPFTGAYDVVVCGGGPAGCSAAIAAARSGLKVLVVEGQGQLGGMGTSGLVSHWLGGRTSGCKDWVVGGVFKELSLAGVERGIALLPQQEPNGRLSPHGWSTSLLTAGVPFDPFAMASLLDEVLEKAGVDVLLFTRVVNVSLKDNVITHVVIHNKSGFHSVPATAVIDATGDADVAALSGCQIVLGREEDNLMTPVTLQMHFDHIDADVLAAHFDQTGDGRWLKEIQELIKQNEWPFPYNLLITVQLTEKDTFMINTSRLVGYDGTNGASVSKAMAQGRRESLQLLAILRKHAPGFRNARIKAIAPLLGVRETRRIVGDFVLTVRNLEDAVPLPDVIGLSAYGWDLPDPKRPSHNPGAGKKKPICEIPYRVMLPKPITNLICPGRSISVERDVLGPMRVMAPCMVMGEAAGVAAAQIVQRKIGFAAVNIEQLRTELLKRGAILEPPR